MSHLVGISEKWKRLLRLPMAFSLWVIELVLQVIIILILVAINPRAPFVSFVSSLALRARLIPVSPFVLIARPANGERTLVASNKDIATFG